MNTKKMILTRSVTVGICLLFALPATWSQNRTYIGIETGPKFDFYRFSGDADGLYKGPITQEPMMGIVLGRDISRSLAWETGLLYHSAEGSFRIKGERSNWNHSLGGTFQIPIRLRLQYPLGERWTLSGALGVSYMHRTGTLHPSAWKRGTSEDNLLIFNFGPEILSRNAFLWSTDMSIAYPMNNRFDLFGSFRYTGGFKDIWSAHIDYQQPGTPLKSATVSTKGSYLSSTIGIRMYMNGGR